MNLINLNLLNKFFVLWPHNLQMASWNRPDTYETPCRQQVLRAYCPNICTVDLIDNSFSLILCQNKGFKVASRYFVSVTSFCSTPTPKTLYLWPMYGRIWNIQVNLCQKHSFLHRLTQSIATDCSLNYKFSARKLQVQYMLCTMYIYCFDCQNKTQSIVHNMYWTCSFLALNL